MCVENEEVANQTNDFGSSDEARDMIMQEMGCRLETAHYTIGMKLFFLVTAS